MLLRPIVARPYFGEYPIDFPSRGMIRNSSPGLVPDPIEFVALFQEAIAPDEDCIANEYHEFIVRQVAACYRTRIPLKTAP